MFLSIITLNYKKTDLTISCIESLYEQLKRELDGNEVEVIVVDNASGDGSVKALEEEKKKNHYKNLTIIANRENAGFAKGCNLGASTAEGKFLLFLNNDTQVRDRGIFEMAKYMEAHPEAAILGGQLRNFDGSLQASSGKFYTLPNALLLLLGLQRFGIIDQGSSNISPVDWVKGAIFMIRSDIFKKLGGFDEKIFMYTEDMELCYRAKINGYKSFFYPDVSVFHKEQGSANRTFAVVNIYKNLLYFYKKHRSWGEYLFLKLILRIKAYMLIAVGRILNNSYLVKTYEQALRV